jgi:hypothetical protein
MHTTHARKTRIQFSHARKTCIQHNIRHIELQLCLSKCLCKARPIDTNNTYKGSAARTVYMHHTSGHFPAKNTSFTVYIYMVLANPTHMVLINLTRTMSRPACACNTRACAYTQMHIRLHSYICLHQVAFILCVYVCVCVCVPQACMMPTCTTPLLACACHTHIQTQTARCTQHTYTHIRIRLYSSIHVCVCSTGMYDANVYDTAAGLCLQHKEAWLASSEAFKGTLWSLGYAGENVCMCVCACVCVCACMYALCGH